MKIRDFQDTTKFIEFCVQKFLWNFMKIKNNFQDTTKSLGFCVQKIPLEFLRTKNIKYFCVFTHRKFTIFACIMGGFWHFTIFTIKCVCIKFNCVNNPNPNLLLTCLEEKPHHFSQYILCNKKQSYGYDYKNRYVLKSQLCTALLYGGNYH